MGILNKLKGIYNKYKEERERIKAIEETKKQKILSGNIQPITVSLNLDKDEKAYVQFNAKRKAVVETITQHTEGKSKKSGGLTRALVGGVLLGPVGAIVGATTAGSKYKEVTKTKKESSLKHIDSGLLIFTNKRIIYQTDDNVKTIAYRDVIASKFSYRGEFVSFQYPTMPNGEEFQLSNPESKFSETYYTGITSKLLIG